MIASLRDQPSVVEQYTHDSMLYTISKGKDSSIGLEDRLEHGLNGTSELNRPIIFQALFIKQPKAPTKGEPTAEDYQREFQPDLLIMPSIAMWEAQRMCRGGTARPSLSQRLDRNVDKSKVLILLAASKCDKRGLLRDSRYHCGHMVRDMDRANRGAQSSQYATVDVDSICQFNATGTTRTDGLHFGCWFRHINGGHLDATYNLTSTPADVESISGDRTECFDHLNRGVASSILTHLCGSALEVDGSFRYAGTRCFNHSICSTDLQKTFPWACPDACGRWETGSWHPTTQDEQDTGQYAR